MVPHVVFKLPRIACGNWLVATETEAPPKRSRVLKKLADSIIDCCVDQLTNVYSKSGTKHSLRYVQNIEFYSSIVTSQRSLHYTTERSDGLDKHDEFHERSNPTKNTAKTKRMLRPKAMQCIHP
ncbi:unnamed protein product [Ectocarpus sp. 8 AP-2014]